MELHVVSVFVGPDGRGGNLLGVFLDGRAIERARRQAIATELGYAETVFVDAVTGGVARIAIFTPSTELPFAGHPTVGTSWLLAETGRPVGTLRVGAGDVATWRVSGSAWVRARPEWSPTFRFEQLATPEAVDAVAVPALGEPNRYVWAWEDEPAGRIRVRSFPSELGIVEDEATGSAAVVIGVRLGRPLTIRQGTGSEVLVRPGPDGTGEVGGRSVLVETRSFS
jgi:predicted PhzF superfamily epimerase YddE/YHI9